MGKIFKRLIKARTDVGERKKAILIINGEIYTGLSHASAMNSYFRSNNIDELNKIRRRIDIENPVMDERATDSKYIEDIKLIQNNVYQLAYAHLMFNNTINLETDSLYNISINEAITLLKKQYPNSEIFDDNSYDSIKEEFKKIANNKRLIKAKWFNSIKNKKDEIEDCFINPNSEEWGEITSKNSGNFRAIALENGDLYIFNSEILHEDAIRFFGLPNGLYINGNNNSIILFLTKETNMEYIYNCFKNCQALFTYMV